VTVDTNQGCQLCDYGRTNDWLYTDDFWLIGPGPGAEQPGWTFLQLRRHAEGLPGLRAEELESFGPIAAHLSEALVSVANAEKVYFLTFLEHYHHFHVLFIPRAASVPVEHRGFGLFANRDKYRNAGATRDFAEALRIKLASSRNAESRA
jgi:diadenosine tetraphosphate (Ap4A) HIT family hydrolase